MNKAAPQGRKILLEANGIVKVFGSGAYEVKPLKGIDLQLCSGELTLLMGPSGSRQDHASVDPRLHPVADGGAA